MLVQRRGDARVRVRLRAVSAQVASPGPSSLAQRSAPAFPPLDRFTAARRRRCLCARAEGATTPLTSVHDTVAKICAEEGDERVSDGRKGAGAKDESERLTHK